MINYDHVAQHNKKIVANQNKSEKELTVISPKSWVHNDGLQSCF